MMDVMPKWAKEETKVVSSVSSHKVPVETKVHYCTIAPTCCLDESANPLRRAGEPRTTRTISFVPLPVSYIHVPG